MAKKIEQTIPTKTTNDASKSLLAAQLKDTEDTHFNSFTTKPVVISSGSLKLDNYLKVKTGGVLRMGGPAEVGKAQPLTSKVLTPTGWAEIGTLKQGSLVIGSDGKPQQVLGIFPQGKLKVNKVIFADGTTVRCCDEHLWYTHDYTDRALNRHGSVKTTRFIKQTLKYCNKHTNHSIPYVKPVVFKYNQTNLPLSAYVLGLLIGDGCFRHRGRVEYTSNDPELVENISQEVPEDFIFKKCNQKYKYECNSKELISILLNLGLWGKLSYDKFIPDIYKYGCIDTRREILRGLLDTDGNNTRNSLYSGAEFSSSSKQLAEDVLFIVRSLGGRATMTSRISTFSYKGEKKNGHVSFRVSISFSDFVPFRLKRKASLYKNRTIELEKHIVDICDDGIEECVCIKVENKDSLYVTDGFNLTHNTSQSLLFANNFMQTLPNSKVMYINAEAKFGEEIQTRAGMKFTRNPDEWDYGTVFIFDTNCFDTICDVLVQQYKQIHEAGGHLAVIIDSVDMLRLKSSFGAKVSDGKKPAGVNYLTKELFRHLCHPITAYNGLLIMITQFSATFTMSQYEKEAPNLMDGNQTHALNHQASYALYYRPRTKSNYILEDDGAQADPVKNKILGVNVRIDVRKSATDSTGYMIEVPIKKDKIGNCIWVEKELFDALLLLSLVSKKGAWIELSDIISKWIEEHNASIIEQNKKTTEEGGKDLLPLLEYKSKHQGISQFSEYFEKNPKTLSVLLEKLRTLYS